MAEKPDSPLSNSMELVFTDIDKLQIAHATTKQELVVARSVIASAHRALKCAGKGALKDKAVQAALAVLAGGP